MATQTTIKGLPVFAATLDGEDCGMIRVSLVDDPAVLKSFQAFEDKPMLAKYAVKDEEQRIVRGVLMRANFPIYREDPRIGGFFITYRPDVIRQMAERYLKEGRSNEVNLMHQDGSDVDGVEMVQLFIKDSKAGINPEGFEEIEDGSLFGEYHVINDEVWNSIKNGTYSGFSIEIYNGIEPVTAIISTEKVPADLMEWLNNFYNNMNVSELKVKLARILGKFGNVTTDKATLSWDGDGELEAGMEVFILGEGGERLAVEDGEYKTEDRKIIVIEGGKVTEIKDDEVKPEESTAGEGEGGEDMAKKKKVCGEGEEPEGSAEIEILKERIDRLEELVGELIEAISAGKAEVAGFKSAIEDLKGKLAQPAAQPAHEEFKAEPKAVRTGDADLDRFAARFSR